MSGSQKNSLYVFVGKQNNWLKLRRSIVKWSFEMVTDVLDSVYSYKRVGLLKVLTINLIAWV